MQGRLKPIHYSWTSNRVDARRTAYLPMEGRMSLAELVEHLAELAPGVPPEDIGVNWATVTWERDATPEERAEREARATEHRRRTEEWERAKLVELTAKYGQPDNEPNQITPGQE
jgi:hypothetical protein